MRKKDVRGCVKKKREGRIMKCRPPFLFVVMIMCLFAAFKGHANDEQYPDGGYGVDWGGGYNETPDGKLIIPGAYRDPYMDTQYGLLTQDGRFDNFPGYSLPGSPADRAKEASKKEELKKTGKELKFHAATTSSAGSLYWGVYDPAKDKK